MIERIKIDLLRALEVFVAVAECDQQGAATKDGLVTTRHSEGVFMGKLVKFTKLIRFSTRRHKLTAALAAIVLTVPTSQAALSDDKQIFDERQIRMIVGMPAGGGVDIYARLVQRHIVNFLPGPPSIIVQNMPGAGSLRSVMATLNSPPDELVINTFSSSLIMQAISEPERVKVDFRHFRFVGNVAEDLRVCFVRSNLGLKTMADVIKWPTPISFGATAAGTSGNLDVEILQKFFGVKIRPVRGYSGAPEKRLAFERGEIDADCSGITSVPDEWIKGNKITMFIRMSPTLVPEIQSSAQYPIDLLTNPADRQVFSLLVAPQQLGRLFMTTDRISASRIAALRKAFDQMVVDKKFIDEARSMGLLVTPMPGDEVDRRVKELYQSSPEVLQKARDIARG
jgi:tripartite-type tricarboxylate transporter receptor subunit TctC